MNLRRHWLIPLALLGWGLAFILLALVEDRTNHPLPIGILFGTMFGPTTLAAAWCAFGPLPLLFRLPLSLVAVGALIFALALNRSFTFAPGGIMFVLGSSLLGLWLLAQIPMWMFIALSGQRLIHLDAVQQSGDARNSQFQIRQLMIFTAIVAIILGVGRAIVAGIAFPKDELREVFTIFGFLVVVAMLVTLPLLLAAFVERRVLLAVLGVLAFHLIFAALEVPLFQSLERNSSVNYWIFLSLNGFTAAWVLAFALAARVCGYRLMHRATSNAS